MTELTTIIFTLIGVGLALAAINITTFFPNPALESSRIKKALPV